MAKKFKRSYTFNLDTITRLQDLAEEQGRSLTNVIEEAIKNEHRREFDGKENNQTREITRNKKNRKGVEAT